MSELVTGDAVVLDVQVAQLPVRAVSSLIDVVVQFILFFAGVIVVALSITSLDSAVVDALAIGYLVLTLVGYPVIFEISTHGKSLGKLIMGLRVVSDDGGPERARQAVVRALAGFVEIFMFMGIPAVFTSLVSAKGKRVGDLFAGTMVISERGPKLAPPPPMPPQLAAWAQTLELSALTDDQANLARQFLSRASQLDRLMLEQLLAQVAASVLGSIAPPPPPGTPPQFMLAAVLAERHRRATEKAYQSPFSTTDVASAPVSPAVPDSAEAGSSTGFTVPN